MTDTTYVGLADTAKMVRKALAKRFPGVKFYVRSKSYAGGASIDVYYDGLDHYEPAPFNGNGWQNYTAVYKPGMPSKTDVTAVASVYGSRGFDGMIDGSYGIKATVNADGDVVGTSSPGSGAFVSAWDDGAPGAKMSFGASYVFVNDELPYDVRKAAA